MKRKKYMRMLITIPNDTYSTFIQNVPNGQRSQYIVHLLDKKLKPKKIAKIPKSAWSKLHKYVKGNYSHEDPVKLAKDAWKDID